MDFEVQSRCCFLPIRAGNSCFAGNGDGSLRVVRANASKPGTVIFISQLFLFTFFAEEERSMEK